MTEVVIQILDDQNLDRPIYLLSYDPDAENGRGMIMGTTEIEAAMKFTDVGEAMEEWRRPSTVHPIRLSDGKPNRPLSALTVTFVTVDDDAV